MIFHTAHLTCRADVVEAFKARLARHARTSVEREPGGCLRFDVHQEATNPALFLLLEEYADERALEAHRASAHYKAFREDTKDWVIDRKWWFWSPSAPTSPATMEMESDRAELKIAVFTKNRTNPAYAAARLGADRAARLLGAQAQHFVPETGDDPDEQSALIHEALAMRPDAFVLTPVHPTRVNAAIASIGASGIPLFGFINPIPAARCASYVGADDYQIGFEIAQYLFAHLQRRGRVLAVSGPVESVTSIARMRAFHDAAESHPAISIVGTCVGDYARDKARDGVAQWLAANDGVDGCLAANDVMALGAIDALRMTGRKAAVAGVNAIPEAIEAIKRGDMLVTADFSAMRMAYLATECAVRHLRGEAVPAEILLPAQIVDLRNCRLWDLPFEQRPIPTLEETLR